jgi:hypothetical protein
MNFVTPKAGAKHELLFYKPATGQLTSMYLCDYTRQGKGKYHCIIDLLLDWFGLVYLANKNKKLSVVTQLIPNLSNRRSTV